MKTKQWGLTQTFRNGQPTGWSRRISGRTVWVCSAAEAPTPTAADRVFERRILAGLDNPKSALVTSNALTIDQLERAALVLLGERLGSREAGQLALDELLKAFSQFCRHLTRKAPLGGQVPKKKLRGLVGPIEGE